MTDIANIELSNEPAITNANVAIFNPQNLMAIQNFATLMASGKSTIPAHLAGNKADCMAVAMQAVQWGMNPFVVAQKTHVVSLQTDSRKQRLHFCQIAQKHLQMILLLL